MSDCSRDLYLQIKSICDKAPSGYLKDHKASSIAYQYVTLAKHGAVRHYADIRAYVENALSMEGFHEAAIDAVAGAIYDAMQSVLKVAA